MIKKLILSILLILIIFCLNNVECQSGSGSGSSTTTTPHYLYALLTDAQFKSNQTLAVIDLETGLVVRNDTFNSLKDITSIVSVNEVENTMLIFALAPANNNSFQLVELDMTSFKFTLVGEKVESNNIQFISIDQPYIFVDDIIYSFGQDADNIDYFYSVESWNFNNGKWGLFSVNVDNFIAKPISQVFPMGTYNYINKMMYSTYQSTQDIFITCVAEFDPLKNGEITNQYNNVTGVVLGLIRLLFTDNLGELYAIQSVSFQNISICKFNLPNNECILQTTITLGSGYQTYRYSPFIQSQDLTRLIILSPSNDSTNEKPIVQILNYEISTWSLISSTSTNNVWTTNENSFDFETLFISN